LDFVVECDGFGVKVTKKTNKMESESSPIVLTSGDNKYK
jgi:hypothetical protein